LLVGLHCIVWYFLEFVYYGKYLEKNWIYVEGRYILYQSASTTKAFWLYTNLSGFVKIKNLLSEAGQV